MSCVLCPNIYYLNFVLIEIILFANCTVLRCPALIPPINGRVHNYCDNFYGSKCTITCNNGYILSGATEMKCEKQQDNEAKWKPLGSDTRCKGWLLFETCIIL